MTKSEIIQKTNAFLTDELELAPEKLVPEARLKEDLGIDSLDVVDVVVLVNENFGFKIKTAEMRDLQTLGQFYDLIEQRLTADAAH